MMGPLAIFLRNVLQLSMGDFRAKGHRVGEAGLNA